MLSSVLFLSSCSQDDNSHTTATTYIAPPPHQVLIVIEKPTPKSSTTITIDPTADGNKPLLVFDLENKKTFHLGEDVPIDFTVQNAKMKGDGGEFRVRYIVDDEEMKWVDTAQPFWLSGWTIGKHTIRLELIGPNGWPYKNGEANIVTKEIEVVQ